MNYVVAPSVSLLDVIRALRGSVGRWAVLGWLSAVLGLLLYRRLGEIERRMERMLARFRAGLLRRAGPRVGVGGRVVAVRPAGAERIWPERVWPGRFGWLVRAASWQAAGFGGQLRLVLAQPEMQALLAAGPQAARVLTPLCRMLAVETSLLRPGVVAVPVVPVVPVVATRVRAPRVAVDFGRIPIPRGVLSAVRRGRFAEG